MIDESMDKEQLAKPPQPYEFRSKKTWQRLLIMLGGVIVNLILGFYLYLVLYLPGAKKYFPTANMTDGVWVVDSVMHSTGLETGDKIISVNGVKPNAFLMYLKK